MRTINFLAVLLFLLTVAASAQQTQSTQVPEIPPAAHWLYDTDGDGKMEFFLPEYTSTYAYPNEIRKNFLKTLSLQGAEIKRYEFPLTFFFNEEETALERVIGIGNYAGDEKPDLFIKRYGERGLNTVLFTGNTDGSFTEKIIKTPGYVGVDIWDTEDEMPAITLDADDDGRTDLYGYDADNGNAVERTKQHFFLLQQPDGSFMRKTIRVLTDGEEIENAMIAKADAPTVAPVAVKFSGVSLAKVLRRQLMKKSESAKAPRATNAEIAWSDKVTAIDLNMDGYPDLIDQTNGGALISIDEGLYYFGTFKGIPTARDLNGDGMLDYILFDTKTKTVTLQIYTGDGGFREQTLMQNMNISNVYCYDFDKDGDVDILLPFDYTTSAQHAFLVFFQNNGDNSFTKKERSFADKLYFKDCRDVDNDGIYEVIAVQQDDNQDWGARNNKLFRFKCLATSGWKVEKDTNPFVENVNIWSNEFQGVEDQAKWIAGDFENNGKTSYYTLQSAGNLFGTFDATTTNTPPAKMPTPTFVADAVAQALRIEWKAGTDDLTATPDLTYALRIGTAPGKSDVLYAYANADGSRRKLGAGNCGSALFRLMRTGAWSAGDYYIAVQAVDAHGRGGAWSSEALYKHTRVSSLFNVGKTDYTTVDTISCTLKAAKMTGYTYTWNFGKDSEIISEENGTWKIVYNTGGQKNISLQVTDDKGNKSELTEKKIEVYAVKFRENALGLYYKNSFTYFDADMNGVMDALSGTNYSNSPPEFRVWGMLKGDGNGKFIKVGKTYNSDLQPKAVHFIDFNMDGLPDFIGNTNKGNLFTNGDDFDFEYSTEDFLVLNTEGQNMFEDRYFSWENIKWIDLNNDGYQDIISNVYLYPGIYLNAGNNKSFTKIELSTELREYWLFDSNRDGFADILNRSNDGKFTIYLNNGNNQFTEKESSMSFNTWGPSIQPFADFNSDSWLDLVTFKGGSTPGESKIIRILLGNPALDYSGEPLEIKLPVADGEWMSDSYFIRDMDNNGYPDVVFYNGILYFYPGMETRWQSIAATHLGNLQRLPDNESRALYPFADMNGDGVPDTKAYDILSRVKNTAPQSPLNVRASQTDEGILLTWDAAADTETPVTQMRYNVSVREKGKSGTGSFIISPMNGLKNTAAAIPDYHGYHCATQMIVPATRFQTGKTYELQVQAIDLWNEHSPFSAAYEFTVESQVNIRMPQSACMNKAVTVSYTGTETGDITWNWDGGTATASGNNTWQVTWNTPGIKNVQATVAGKTATRPLRVRDDVDLTFSLPATVLAKCDIPFTLPALFSDPAKTLYVRTSDHSQAVAADDVSGMSVVAPADADKITVRRRAGSLDAVVVFPKNDAQWIELVYNDESCGEITYRKQVNVVGENLTPQISVVTVDGATGKNKISWVMPTDIDTQVFNKIEIYKEMGSTHNFVKIDEVPLTAGMYLDQASDPLVRKSRYRIALGTTFGGTSNPSAVHSSVHVMINRGLGSDINLIWGKYEGALIDSYTILRGTSPDNMQVIATASGYENSYTDRNAPENVYYALSYNAVYSDKWITLPQAGVRGHGQRAKQAVANTVGGLSNVVSSNQSTVVTFANRISILSIERETELKPEQPTLHLYAEVLPAMATYKRVNWQIVTGKELASISDNGLLTYTGAGTNGNITVKATAIDGSSVSSEKTIQAINFSGTGIDDVQAGNTLKNYIFYPNPAKDYLQIQGISGKTLIQIRNLAGVLVYNGEVSADTTIPVSAYAKGVYVVTAVGEKGTWSGKIVVAH